MAGGQATRPPAMATTRRRLRLLLLLATAMATASLTGPPPPLVARALRPPPTVTCGSAGGSDGSCTVTNYYGAWADRAPCRFREALYPRTERELVAAVARAARAGAPVRVAAAGAHSFPKLACPREGDGVLISTRDLNRRVRVDARARTVTADAGVTLRDLVRALSARGMALPHGPVWGGVTVAGMIGTGAHGSSVWGRGGAVHEYVTRVRVVVPADEAHGFARVRTVVARNGSLEMAAWRVHLGVLGAISQVTLRVQPQFKRSVTFHITSDAELETKLLTLAQEHEFGEANWYPAQKVVRYRLDSRVPMSTPGDGVAETFGHVDARSMRASRSAELEIERTRDESGQCARAAGALHYLTTTGFGLASNKSSPGVFQGYPVVGLSHDIMTSSGCWDELPEDAAAADEPTQVCLWDLGPKGIFVFNIGVSLPFTKVGAFIQDLRRLAALRPEAMCSLESYGGVWMRFVKGTGSALLGLAHDSVDIDITFRRSTHAHAPRMHQDVLDEVEQMAVLKHGGAPHWGKGRPATFAGLGPETYPGLADFLRVKRALDPRGLFSNAWTDAVLGVRGSVTDRLKPGCALEGLCVCSRDEHCAPYAGYFCRPGLVYKQARVCRFEGAAPATAGAGRRHHAQS